MAAGLVAFASRFGVDRVTLLCRAGISPQDISDPDKRVPFHSFVDLTRAAQEMANDPALSLKYAEQVGMSELSVLGLIMEASATMGEAFLQLQRYGALVAEVIDQTEGPQMVLTVQSGRLYLEDRRMAGNGFHELREGAFARLVCGPRRFLSQPHVLSVHFSHPAPSYHAEYERIFQCPVYFDQPWNALELHPEVAQWPVRQNPAYVFGILTKHADKLMMELSASKTLTGRTESLLLNVLHTGDVNVEAIAAQLGMSRQTLFRRLKSEGTTFAELLDALRCRLAKEYLSGRKASVHETAYLLGFSEPGAFSRAFKRWTGLPPKAFVMRQS